MSNVSVNQSDSVNHLEIAELIPWYASGKLSSEEDAMVKEHLTQCQLCRQALENCRQLSATLKVNKTAWQPSAAHFSSILANVDKLEAELSTQAINPKTAKIGFFQRFKQMLQRTPSPVRWTLAAETLAFAVLAGLIILPGHLKLQDYGKSFETLSNAEAPAGSSGQMFHLVFAETMTAQELSALLQQVHGQIRQGPNAVGAYTVEVPASESAQAQAMLKADPQVKLVLPVK